MALLPTPTAQSYGTNQGGSAGRTGPLRPSLQTMALRNLWPTPLATDGSKGGPNQRGGKGDLRLASAVHLWPTPAARDWRSGKGRKDNGHTPQLPEQIGGQLNPRWVEWLMGWPIGWAALEPLGMDRFQQWLGLHGRRSDAA